MAVELGERVRGVEVEIGELRKDVADLNAEVRRSRQRLHSLEGTAAALVLESRERRRRDERRDRRLEIRLHVLTIAVAGAGIVVPLVLGGHHL